MGLTKQLKLHGNEFSNTATAFFIAYLIAEIPNGASRNYSIVSSISQLISEYRHNSAKGSSSEMVRSKRRPMGNCNGLHRCCKRLPLSPGCEDLSGDIRSRNCSFSDAYQQPVVYKIRGGSAFQYMVCRARAWTDHWWNSIVRVSAGP